LITLGFATISGVRLGFGYNSSVKTPKLEEITQFPFINDSSVAGVGNDPMKILDAMVKRPPQWVTSMNNSHWLAAGLTLTAFDILSVTAVAMVQFKEAGLIISIIADAIAQMPPGVSDRSLMIAYVEIGFICEMNMVDGYFRVEAALAPTSFLLVPACRIYGGMALVYWFAPNQHAGDWVFTVGGYHRKFEKPEWYPTVQRLGISFSIGSCLQVTGETYFAITPKVVMGGALIHVTLSVGPVSAWLDAGFDALVQFHPLHYNVDFHVSVGVAFDADVWFVHIHISCSVGAWLEIQGPEFGGIAHVDFYMFSFDVDFGASPTSPPPMTLLEFWQMLHKPGPNVESQKQEDADPPKSLVSYDKDTDPATPSEQKQEDGAAFKFALEDGNIPQPTKKPPENPNETPPSNPTSTGTGTKWHVKGGSLKFRVTSDFAISKATVVDTGDVSPVSLGNIPPGEIFSRPMHVSQPITSPLKVTIREKANSEITSGWRSIEADMKAMPLAAFGAYDVNLDPSKTKDPAALLSKESGTVPLMMGVIITSPLPILRKGNVGGEDGLIPNAVNVMIAGIKDWRGIPQGQDGNPWFIPAFEPPQRKYLPVEITVAEQRKPKPQRWKELRDAWNALDGKQEMINDKDNGFLKQCNDVFGWEKTQLQKPPAPPPPPPVAGTPAVPVQADTYQAWKLKGDLPVKMITNLERWYLDVPGTAVV
jgi:hypothetical protein